MTTILRFINKRYKYSSVTPGVRPYISFINESKYSSHLWHLVLDPIYLLLMNLSIVVIYDTIGSNTRCQR
jgi:hypothetical protein